MMKALTLLLGAALAATAAATKGTVTYLVTVYDSPTTTTIYTRSVSTVYTKTVSTTYTTDSYTVRVTGTVTGAPSTITKTYTVPRPTTKTIPAAKQLTPLPKESFYTDVLVTSTSTIDVRAVTFSYLRPTSTTTTVFTDVSVVTHTITSNYASTVTPTVTRTVTTSPATPTVYAACAASNIVSKTPNGGYISQIGGYDGIGIPVDSYSPVDCCTKCAMRPDCFGGYYTPKAVPDSGLAAECRLAVIDNTGFACNGSAVHGSFDSRGNPKSPLIYVFNGKCGQFIPDYYVETV